MTTFVIGKESTNRNKRCYLSFRVHWKQKWKKKQRMDKLANMMSQLANLPNDIFITIAISQVDDNIQASERQIRQRRTFSAEMNKAFTGRDWAKRRNLRIPSYKSNHTWNSFSDPPRPCWLGNNQRLDLKIIFFIGSRASFKEKGEC